MTYAGGVAEPNLVTRFLPFAGYYVLGWCLRDVLLSARSAFWMWTSFAVSVALTAVAAAADDFGSLGVLGERGAVLRRPAPLAFGVPDDLVGVIGSTVGLTTGYIVVSAAVAWVLLRLPYVRTVLGEPARR